ncbi:PREDICTED: uncharacterized protein LOC109219918 [Nicotiana attenuata]|uniref:uncharacterized protein LOC109219918 n=1 Tax=Nicotiana attenuata TaxID=49451 RepID=UPI000905231A|nr:PREDICTED: uncharacterized protein LOC109219918 [Nicotiana attenuata]
MQNLDKAEEISWRQKSRCRWLKEGDNNTKYFQKLANSNRRHSSIDKLKVGSEVIDDKELIKEEILNYYHNLYAENEVWRPTTNFEEVAKISAVDNEMLEAVFDKEEVHAVIQSCAPDKAPGLDGFTMVFFQKARDFIKPEVLGALNHFHQHCHMIKSCNASFIALLPKKKGAMELRDYRTISLIGSVYKIISKLLAERLKKVIGKLVSSHQNAFIKHSQITNASLIANETLDWRIKIREPGVMCKLDIEKAFHLLNCNGRTNIGNSVTVSHLLYADDTLIFCEPVTSQLLYLNLAFLLFEALLGLHINMLKSFIYPVNDVPNLEELSNTMGCTIGSFPTTYLGLPLGAKYKNTEIWNGIIGKFEKRLAAWQMRYLSMGGRLNLINSVLDSIPTYYMSLFPIPSKAGNDLNISFWKDKWLNNIPLMEVYPNFFQIAQDKNSSIAQNRCGNSWNVLFRRYVQDWELDSVLELLASSERCTIDETKADRLSWGDNKLFTVKECYQLLSSLNHIIDSWPWKQIWKTKMPAKVICFS